MPACSHFLHIWTLMNELYNKGVCSSSGFAFLSCSLLRSPPLFPPAAQERYGGSGLAGSRSHSLSPGWIFTSPQIPSAKGYWLLPLTLFLAAPTNWNLIN